MAAQYKVLFHRHLTATIGKLEWDGAEIIKVDFPDISENMFEARITFMGSEDLEEGGRLAMFYLISKDRVAPLPLCVDLSFVFKGKDEEISSISVKNGKGPKNLKIKTFVNKEGSKSITKNTRTFPIFPERLFDEHGQFVLEAEVSVQAVVSTDEFATNMSSILDDKESSDVTLESENMEYKCHQNILKARSPVFRGMLANQHFLESETNTVKLKNYSDQAVANMIAHMYTGSVPEAPPAMSEDLLTLADMYQLDTLKKACIGAMIDCLNVTSCITTFIMIDRILPVVAPERKTVMSFIFCKVLEVVDSENWSKLVTSFPELVTELFREMGERGRKNTIHFCQFCVIGKHAGVEEHAIENGDF